MSKNLVKVNSLIIAAVFVWYGFRCFWLAITLDELKILRTIIGIIATALAIGLYKQYRWVLRGVACLFVIIAIFLPSAMFNPFLAGDYIRAGLEPPSVQETLVWLVPFEMFFTRECVYISRPEERKDSAVG